MTSRPRALQVAIAIVLALVLVFALWAVLSLRKWQTASASKPPEATNGPMTEQDKLRLLGQLSSGTGSITDLSQKKALLGSLSNAPTQQ